MAKEKRTKPCSNCKKSKVKCIYTSNLPCERCVKTGQALHCQFVPKLPSLQFVAPKAPPAQDGIRLPPLNSLSTHVPLGRPGSHHSQPPPSVHDTFTHQSHPPSISNSSHISSSAPNHATSSVPTVLSATTTAPLHQTQSFANGIPSYTINQIQSPNNMLMTQKNGANNNVTTEKTDSDHHWKNQMENKINTFDNKLNDLVDILKTNQRFLIESQERLAQGNNHSFNSPPPPPGRPRIGRQYSDFAYPPSNEAIHAMPAQYASLPHSRPYSPDDYNYSSGNQFPPHDNAIATSISQKRHIPIIEHQSSHKKARNEKFTNNIQPSQEAPKDFRDGFLNRQQAKELFRFFDEHISPQLFGFEISRFSVDSIWESSPILICAICTIASMHHPDQNLTSKSRKLREYLHDLCGELIYKGRPRNELDGFNTIMALILCSFWLSNSQMFTGLALQIAKEIGLNIAPSNKHRCQESRTGHVEGSLSERDRLKLWYLLYVLDGQQSLTFNRQRLVSSEEYTLRNSKNILLNRTTRELTNDQAPQLTYNEGYSSDHSHDGEIEAKSNKNKTDHFSHDEVSSQRFTDMRLVSQVEYNQALNEAFRGDAWDLLAPTSLGIPSKSNLELDRWMVSWAVLLSPVNNGAVWSSKSTLIYYNFAKMHINSSAVRQLRIDAGDEDRTMLPRWDSSANNGPERPATSPKKIKEFTVKNKTVEEDSEDSEDSDSDNDFVSNKELISDDEAIVSANIAVTAAQTVLNLVLNDKDILNNLKYVPVHIHIMLYYAALLLINPPLESAKRVSEGKEEYLARMIENLKTVKTLQNNIYLNLPTDRNFGDRLIRSLDDLVNERLKHLKDEINDADSEHRLDADIRIQLYEQLAPVMQGSDSQNLVEIQYTSHDGSNKGSSPGPEKISAWPGSHHGHP